jgi:hypothetical protein
LLSDGILLSIFWLLSNRFSLSACGWLLLWMLDLAMVVNALLTTEICTLDRTLDLIMIYLHTHDRPQLLTQMAAGSTS